MMTSRLLKVRVLLFMFAVTPLLVSAQSYFHNAPCWVTNSTCTNYTKTAIGLSHVSYITNPQLATMQAQHNAMSNLSLFLESKVLVNTHSNSLLREQQQQKKTLATAINKTQIRSELAFKGVRFLDKWLDQQGILYILIVVDEVNAPIKSELTPQTKVPKVNTQRYYKAVIKSNMEYAQHVNQHIRQDIQNMFH